VRGWFFRAFARVLSVVPVRLLHGLAHPLSALIWRISRRLRTVARTNVALCYPDLSAEAQEQRARRSLYHYACNALEVGVCWYAGRRRFDALFDPPVGLEHVAAARDAGLGLVVMAPHFGAWELLGLSLSDLLAVTLYKPGSDPEVDAVLIERRERFGATLVPANRRGLKALMDRLKAAEPVGVLPDQEPTGGDGRFAPFFNVPALTGVLVPRLIQRSGAQAVYAACVRGERGRFQVHFIPAGEDLHSPDLDVALSALNRGVEAVIALAPDQYLWAYKRFRARPEGQPKRY
jgi:KDO2-lipid IV(A) lauroyltransferase